MNRIEMNKYREMPETKQAELAAGLYKREDIAIERASDAIDEVPFAGEREAAIRNLDRESNLLRNVRSALARIADKSYGVCLPLRRGDQTQASRCGSMGQILHPLSGSCRPSRIRGQDNRRMIFWILIGRGRTSRPLCF
jgi:hypothetical protein